MKTQSRKPNVLIWTNCRLSRGKIYFWFHFSWANLVKTNSFLWNTQTNEETNKKQRSARPVVHDMNVYNNLLFILLAFIFKYLSRYCGLIPSVHVGSNNVGVVVYFCGIYFRGRSRDNTREGSNVSSSAALLKRGWGWGWRWVWKMKIFPYCQK